MSEHPLPAQLLSSNVQWAHDVTEANPGFFPHLAKGQAPKILWLGCADSRVPESVITAAKPGDIFVHRNIANQFQLHDDSAQAILSYALNAVKVEHVIVVGHTSCGGAAACLAASKNVNRHSNDPVITEPSLPAQASLNRWLAPLTKLSASLGLSGVAEQEAMQTLVEENVKVQVSNITESETIAAAWAAGKNVSVHGWLFDIASGKLKDLGISVSPSSTH